MKEVRQLEISLEDAARSLLRERGITEGWWILGFEFQNTAGVIGSGQEEALPAAIARVKKIILANVAEPKGAHPPFLINAAELASPPKRRKAAAKE